MSEAASSESRPAIRTFLVHGGILIGLATVLERGLQFIANILAARNAGEENLGVYALAMQTAGFLASQASLGIGMVATRFSAEYPVDHPQNRAFIQRIAQLSLGLAMLASVLMLLLAWPMAHWFYNKPQFYRVLIITVVTAPAFVLLDAVRGLLLGLSYHRGLVILSAVLGICMLLLMPWAAMRSPRWMLVAHASSAFISCFILYWIIRYKYGLRLFAVPTQAVPMSAMLRFGFFQLGSSTAINLVMMTLMALLLRYATPEQTMATTVLPVAYLLSLAFLLPCGFLWMLNLSLAYIPLFGFREVGYYNAASSMRNLTTTVPGLLNQLTIGLMTRLSGDRFGGGNRVVLINCWLTAIFMIPVTAIMHVCVAWLLPLLYKGFHGAVQPASYLLSVALVHMISQPAVNRLTVVSPRTVALIQVIWMVVALAVALLLVPDMRASGVALSLLIAHSISALLVPLGLRWNDCLPRHLMKLTIIGVSAAALPLFFFESQPVGLLHWSHLVILSLAGLMFTLVFVQYSEIRKYQ
ncbi:MAG TPA: oligosaccharide flippase family protein [Gemmatales bacterium]|nr:oligosaccharide flippase family protein [Gemmatales bacterium]